VEVNRTRNSNSYFTQSVDQELGVKSLGAMFLAFEDEGNEL
jgi:hypothetical protein